MKTLRVYADTSVWGGCFDPEFAEDSCRVIDAVKEGRVVLLVSDLLVRELEPAPEPVRALLAALPAHIAIATVARADAVVSWNFRHIVRLDKIKAYNQVNLANGYGILTIVSPKEVRFDEPA